MIFPLGGLLLGALGGAVTARLRGGRKLDMVHWAAIWGVIGALIGLFAMVFLIRGNI